MNQAEKRVFLIRELLNELPRYKDTAIPTSPQEQKRLLDQGKKQAAEKTDRNNELLSQLNAMEARLKEISSLKIHIINYIRTKDVYQEYHQHGNSKKFAATHEQELAMHREAKKAFEALDLKKLPSVKSLSAEYESILEEKKRLYAEYRQVHEQMREMLTVRANMEQMLKQDEALKEQERSRANVR